MTRARLWSVVVWWEWSAGRLLASVGALPVEERGHQEERARTWLDAAADLRRALAVA